MPTNGRTTIHGWMFPNTSEEYKQLKLTANCDGRPGFSGLCDTCTRQIDVHMLPPAKCGSDGILFKVFTAISLSEMDEEQNLNAIESMLNSGIIFLERSTDSW